MVLQQGGRAPVWGSAAAAERLVVRLDGPGGERRQEVVADKDGLWRCDLSTVGLQATTG